MAKLTINSGVLNQLLRDVNGPVGRTISTTADRIADRARQLVRTDTGRLQSAITVVTEATTQGPAAKVIADTPYATAEHEGIKPHRIPASGIALHFFWPKVVGAGPQGLGTGETFVPVGGGFVTHFDRRGRLFIGKGGVDHPGTTGTHFLTRAAEEVVRSNG